MGFPHAKAKDRDGKVKSPDRLSPFLPMKNDFRIFFLLVTDLLVNH